MSSRRASVTNTSEGRDQNRDNFRDAPLHDIERHLTRESGKHASNTDIEGVVKSNEREERRYRRTRNSVREEMLCKMSLGARHRKV